MQSRQVSNENNQHTVTLSTDEQHVIIGMHNLEHKQTQHTVEWVETLGLRPSARQMIFRLFGVVSIVSEKPRIRRLLVP